jgi:hypothetical protein
MACTITLGRALDCKDALGGLSKIFFVDDFEAGLVTAAGTGDGTAGSATVSTTAGETFTITDLPAMTVLQYDLRPDLSSFTINVQSDPATGASLFEQTLNVVLQKHQEQDPEQLRLISRNRSQIFVLDNNDNVFLFGAAHGMDLNGGTLTSGAARNEMSGHTLTFTGREAAPYYLLEATAGAGTAVYPFDGLTTPANVTITTG